MSYFNAEGRRDTQRAAEKSKFGPIATGGVTVLESKSMFYPKPLHYRPLESRANLFAD